ncbi:hypothetical protein LOTGIDRAFT_109978 [Lottia gigantea]|uniref:RNA polymerase III subunit C25 n=1 Tax=Lottia gigantea TaxID=225164 RepID=V4BDQ1_LOTGI|nr:hypothetical protein LOTGIDRAFT_109978 [Lottia gigantea]ESP03852.1 hypothetical protein LOTGIDRAFT_109978 [Lottia gigantea]
MFVLCEMKDTVRIPPWEFKENTTDAIMDILNKKFANKVVYNVGLCIALWDLVKLEDSFIFPGDGATHTNVHFRYVVFRPFIDEILVGKIKCSSKEGVYVSMGFFDDIFIPADALQHPAIFESQDQIWAWEYEVDEDTKHKLFMDIDEEIRFRVVDETFTDTTPSGPDTTNTESDIPTDPELKKPPYTITASISDSGLGCMSWWNG